MSFVKIFRRKKSFSDSVLEKGKTVVVNGQEVVIFKRVKADTGQKGIVYNNFQSFIGMTKNGQRMYIQESDVACKIKLTKTIIHHEPAPRLFA